jgi:acetate kinase
MSSIFQKKVEDLNLIICHLGNGSSICLVKNGLSYNTTMGLTPLAGLMMGTRSGDIDPSILAYMAKQLNQDVFQITDTLNQQSGLKGVSQLSSDMRDIIQGMNQQQKLPTLAFEKYTNIIADFIVKFANELNPDEKLDGIVFTAGIGENSPEVRQAVINRLPLLKLQLDQEQNNAHYVDTKLISSVKSTIPVYAIRTNEELMICQQSKILAKK